MSRRSDIYGFGKTFCKLLFGTTDPRSWDLARLSGSERAFGHLLERCIAWQPGELQSEIERGAWFVLSPEPSLVLRQPQGLWEELVQRSKRAANAI